MFKSLRKLNNPCTIIPCTHHPTLCVRARALVCLCATLRVRVCASASEGLPVWFKAEALVWRWSVMMRTSVMCPAVIWLDIKIRVTTRTWPCPIVIYSTRRGAWSARKGARDANTRVRPRALDMADSYQNIGIVYNHQENKVEATEMYTKACRIFHKVLGPDHPGSLGLKRFVKVD